MKDFIETPSSLKQEKFNEDDFNPNVVQDFSSMMESLDETRGLTVNIIAPITGYNSYMSKNIDNIRDYIDRTNSVRYKNNITINVHDTESNSSVFKQKTSKLIANGERYFVHLGDSDDTTEWLDLTKSFDPYSKDSPIMFSCTSTAVLENRIPSLVRLTANDNAMFQALTLKMEEMIEENGKDVLVYCEDTVFGRSLKELFEEEYVECETQIFDSSNYKNIGSINEEYKNIIFIGNDNYSKDIYNSISHIENRSYIFYDALTTFTPSNDKADYTHFFRYSGELVDSNKFKSGIVEEFSLEYGKSIENYELSMIDIINALSYSTLAREQDIFNLVELTTAFGQYSGSFHFNDVGDRDNYFFSSFSYSTELNRLAPNELTRINESFFIDDDEKYSLTKSDVDLIEDFTVVRDNEDSLIDQDVVQFDYIKIIDITGNFFILSEEEKHDGVFQVAMSDTVYAENDEIIHFVAPSIIQSEEGAIVSSMEWTKNETELLKLKFWGKLKFLRSPKKTFRKAARVVKKGVKKVKRGTKKVVQRVRNTARSVARFAKKGFRFGGLVVSNIAGGIRNAVKVGAMVARGLPPKKAFDMLKSDFDKRKGNIASKARDLSKSFNKIIQDVKSIGSAIAEVAEIIKDIAIDTFVALGDGLKTLVKLLVEHGGNILSSLFQRLTNSRAFEIAGAIFKHCISIGGSIFTGVMNLFSQVISDLKELKEIAGRVLQSIFGDTDLIGKLTNLIETSIDFWVKEFKPVTDFLVGIISDMATQMLEDILPLFEKMFQLVVTAFERIRPVFDNLIKILTRFMENIDWSIVTNIVTSVTKKLSDGGNFLKFLTTGENSILNIIKDQISIIIDMIDFDAFVTSLQDFESLIEDIANIVSDILDGMSVISDLIMDIFGMMTEEIGNVLMKIMDKVFPTLQTFIDNLMPHIEKLFDGIEPIIAGIKSIFMPLYEQFENSDVFNKITEIFTGFIKGDNFKEYMDKIMSALSDEENILNKIITAVINIITNIADTLKGIVDFIGDILDLIDSIINIDSMSSLLETVMDVGKDLIDFDDPTEAKGLMKTINKFFKPIVAKFKEMFTDFIDRLVNIFKPLFGGLGSEESEENKLVEIVKSVGDIFFDLLETTIEIVVSIMGALASVITITTRVVEAIGNICFPYLMGIITPLKQALDLIVKLIKNLLFVLKMVIKPLLEGFEFLFNTITGILSQFSENPDDETATDEDEANAKLNKMKIDDATRNDLLANEDTDESLEKFINEFADLTAAVAA